MMSNRRLTNSSWRPLVLTPMRVIDQLWQPSGNHLWIGHQLELLDLPLRRKCYSFKQQPPAQQCWCAFDHLVCAATNSPRWLRRLESGQLQMRYQRLRTKLARCLRDGSRWAAFHTPRTGWWFFGRSASATQRWSSSLDNGQSQLVTSLQANRFSQLQCTLSQEATVSNFGGTFDQLFLEIFLWNFNRRCLSTFSIPGGKQVKKDQKLKSRGQDPLEAILCIFGRRALIFFFCLKALGKIWKMTQLLCACAVVITLKTQKCRKSAPRSVEFNFYILCNR